MRFATENVVNGFPIAKSFPYPGPGVDEDEPRSTATEPPTVPMIPTASSPEAVVTVRLPDSVKEEMPPVAVSIVIWRSAGLNGTATPRKVSWL